MTSSRTLATETYSPWKKRTEWAPRVHENIPNSAQTTGSQSIHGTMIHALAQASHDIPSEAIQYAPPLSAYSTNYCGASSALAEYNRSLQLRAFSGIEDIPILSPRTMNRLDTLRQLKTAGYTTLAPIGLNKTMKQIEADRLADIDDGAYIQAENSVAAGTSTMGEASSLHNLQDHNLSSPSATAESIPSTNMLPNSMDRDLDRQIVDVDINDSADLDADLDEDSPDAFMAEDVEYQYDHSLELGSNNGLTGTGDVNVTFSAITGLSSAPTGAASAPTVSTSAPTAPSRPGDDSDIDMTLED